MELFWEEVNVVVKPGSSGGEVWSGCMTKGRRLSKLSVWPWEEPRERGGFWVGGLAKTAGEVRNRETLSCDLTPAV